MTSKKEVKLIAASAAHLWTASLVDRAILQRKVPTLEAGRAASGQILEICSTQLKGHKRAAACAMIAATHNGRCLLWVAWRDAIRVFDSKTQKLLAKSVVKEGGHCEAMVEVGDTIWSAGVHGKVCIWDKAAAAGAITDKVTGRKQKPSPPKQLTPVLLSY
eukprot:jgi/Bigna1/84002/fgenesh1_pg.120_\